MTANAKGPREDAEGSGDGERDSLGIAVETELPDSLTVAETLEWVSTDKARAQKALDVESKREHPRSGVTGPLEQIVNEETGAGVASGEA